MAGPTHQKKKFSLALKLPSSSIASGGQYMPFEWSIQDCQGESFTASLATANNIVERPKNANSKTKSILLSFKLESALTAGKQKPTTVREE